MSTRCVVRQALHVLQNTSANHAGEGDGEGGEEGEGRFADNKEFTLWVRAARDAPPTPLQGSERPHAIQVIKLNHFFIIMLNQC